MKKYLVLILLFMLILSGCSDKTIVPAAGDFSFDVLCPLYIKERSFGNKFLYGSEHWLILKATSTAAAAARLLPSEPVARGSHRLGVADPH